MYKIVRFNFFSISDLKFKKKQKERIIDPTNNSVGYTVKNGSFKSL